MSIKKIENIGEKVGSIPVSISYRIIELFSAGLYSSPNKAFEELVCNSYDAHANKVAVFVPSDKTGEDAVLWVCDNGDSMDDDGLQLLWKIGETNKRSPSYDEKDRPPIGKFGIGKLATYILARKLTHICKSEGVFRIVTMDYNRVDQRSDKPTDIGLDVRILTEMEVIEILKPLIEKNRRKLLDFDLWGDNAEDTWTFALMSDLKTMAEKIEEGRLRWILSTALPLNPGFNLFYNGGKVEPSKVSVKPRKTWVIGDNDETAKKFKYVESTFQDQPCVNLPHINNIHGVFELYRDSLLSGKSQVLGRSHGIFVMVRGRLVNIDNPLFGMSAMSHGVFNRIRIIIHADELDGYLTSTRESIKESEQQKDLQKYIQRKFEKVKTYYFDLVEDEERERSAAYKISHTSTSLSRRPLLVVARKFFNREINELFLTIIPTDLSKDQQNDFISKLEDDLVSERGIIKDVTWEAIAPEAPIARLDLESGIARINLLHPFLANFSQEVKSTLPFKLIATTEILTEAYLIESSIAQETVKAIMERRDELLREVTYSDKPNAPYVAQMIQSTLSNPSGLEEALLYAFRSLGFDAIPIGGKGNPDGKANATLRDSEGIRSDYSVVFDAKSTGKDKIKAATAKISASVRHRNTNKANYSVIVAVDFEGADNQESAISKEAKEHKVSCIRAKDLWSLVLLVAPKQITLLDLKNLFENCHTVIETSEWIENIKKRVIQKRPIKELLDTTYKLMTEDEEPPHINAIRVSNDTLKRHSVAKLTSLIKSLENLVGRLISINSQGIVSIQSPPEKILESMNKVLESDIPPELAEAYLKAFKVE